MTSANILITGAAGYIGGSLVSDFIANKITSAQSITAAVRSEEQAEALSKLGVNVVRLDLGSEQAVTDSILQHKINIVIQTASSIEPKFSLNLVTALGKRKSVSGEQTHYIHTSGTSAFYEKTGWPRDVTKDTDAIFGTEKRLADSFSIRNVDVAVTEHAKALGVTSFIVIPSQIYGKGSGEWNKLSVVFPVYVKACIAQKTVHKFPENTKSSGAHITDLTSLYGQIVTKVLKKEELPSNEEGYYFALAHDLHWWEVLDHLATSLKARGLVTDSTIQTWPSDAAAAEALGVPEQFLQVLWNAGANMTAEKPYQIGWQPKWDKKRFLTNIDDEIDAVVEEGQAKSSLIDSLFAASRG